MSIQTYELKSGIAGLTLRKQSGLGGEPFYAWGYQSIELLSPDSGSVPRMLAGAAVGAVAAGGIGLILGGLALRPRSRHRLLLTGHDGTQTLAECDDGTLRKLEEKLASQ